MDTKNNPQGLLYLNEHIACKNYLTGDRALFEIINLATGKLFIRESLGRSSLVFLLSGEIYNPQIERYAVLKRSVQFFAEVSKRSVQFSSKHKRHSNNL